MSIIKYILKWINNKGYVGYMCSYVDISYAIAYDTIKDAKDAQERIKNRFNSETKIFELIISLGEEIE